MLRFKASSQLYKVCSTKTKDRHLGLLQSLFLASSTCPPFPRDVTRSPAALAEPVVFPLVTKCKSLPCVILIIDHVVANHVLAVSHINEPKSGLRVQCA